MKNNSIVAIVGGALLFVLGFVIGLMAGGPDVDDIAAAVAERTQAASSAEAERLAGVEASLGQISTDVAALGSDLESRESAVGDLGTKLGGDIEGLGQSLTGSIESATASHLAALESGLAGIRGQISSAPAAEAPAPAAGAAASVADPGTPPQGQSAGQTAVLSDGALRVFVSRVDDEAGEARVRANGRDVSLAVGQSETLAGETGDCRVTLDALDRGHAALSGACGDALPEPEGAAPGSIVDLAEGLRVFVSGVTDAGARIAVNGVETTTLPVGESVEVMVGERACEVSVEKVDRGHVALGYACAS